MANRQIDELIINVRQQGGPAVQRQLGRIVETLEDSAVGAELLRSELSTIPAVLREIEQDANRATRTFREFGGFSSETVEGELSDIAESLRLLIVNTEDTTDAVQDFGRDTITAIGNASDQSRADLERLEDSLISLNSAARRAGQGLGGVGAGATRSSNPLIRAGGATERLERGLAGTTRQGRGASRTFSSLARAAGPLTVGYAAVAATLFAVSEALRLLTEGEALTRLEEVGSTIGVRIGIPIQNVARDIQRLTGFTVSYSDALRQATRAASFGFSTDQISQLTEAARLASVALGVELGDALNRAISGVSRLEVEVLDEIGITTRLTEAYERYAAELGVSVDSLSSYQQRTALVNEVNRQATERFGDLADIARQGAPWETFGANASEAFNSVLSGIASTTSSFANFFNELAQENRDANSAAQDLAAQQEVIARAQAETERGRGQGARILAAAELSILATRQAERLASIAAREDERVATEATTNAVVGYINRTAQSVDATGQLVDATGNVTAAYSASNTALLRSVQGTRILTTAERALEDGIEATQTAVTEQSATLGASELQIRRAADAIRGLQQAARETPRPLGGLRNSLTAQNTAGEQASLSIINLQQEYQRLESSLAGLSESSGAYGDIQAELARILQVTGLETEAELDRVTGLARGYLDNAAALRTLNLTQTEATLLASQEGTSQQEAALQISRQRQSLLANRVTVLRRIFEADADNAENQRNLVQAETELVASKQTTLNLSLAILDANTRLSVASVGLLNPGRANLANLQEILLIQQASLESAELEGLTQEQRVARQNVILALQNQIVAETRNEAQAATQILALTAREGEANQLLLESARQRLRDAISEEASNQEILRSRIAVLNIERQIADARSRVPDAATFAATPDGVVRTEIENNQRRISAETEYVGAIRSRLDVESRIAQDASRSEEERAAAQARALELLQQQQQAQNALNQSVAEGVRLANADARAQANRLAGIGGGVTGGFQAEQGLSDDARTAQRQTVAAEAAGSALQGITSQVEGLGAVTAGLNNISQAFLNIGESGVSGLQVATAGLQIFAGVLQNASAGAISEIDQQIQAERKRDGQSEESQRRIRELQARKIREQRKAAIQQILISTAVGVANSLASGPFPANLVAAGITAAAGVVALRQANQSSSDQLAALAASGGDNARTTSISVGERENRVNVGQAATGGELDFVRGAAGTGTANNFTPRAAGGVGSPGVGFVAGENGPELITPLAPLQVTNAQRTQDLRTQSSGGGSLNLSINALDAQSIVDRAPDIADALQVELEGRGMNLGS